MNERIGIGKAHGKIILSGEHSVVYFEPAIALPFKELTLTVEITPSEQMTIESAYHRGLLSDAPQELANLQLVIKETLANLQQNQETFHLKIDSLIPFERGMGSSAAVANAIVLAIFDYFNKEVDEQTLFNLVQSAEMIAHGNASGLDGKITISKQPIYFIKNQTPTLLDINLNGYLVVADTGEKGKTAEAVSSLKRRKEESPFEIDQLIKRLGMITKQIKIVLKEGTIRELGHLLNESQQHLEQLGVSNDSLDHLIEIANNHGALGAKLTGGGKGGCMFAVADTQDKVAHLEKALLDAGATQTWVLQL